MLILLLPLLPWLFCHWAYGADFHAINMFHRSYFPDSSSVEVVGNATLDGKLTHTLKGHNEQINVSQLLPLEPSHLWKQRKSNLRLYLQQFQDMVKVTARERNVAYPFHVQCAHGCLIFHNGTSHSFYDVALNGLALLKFYAANTTWVPLEASSVAWYASSQLNMYNETTKSLQFFLQKTCVNFVREHSDVNQPLTGVYDHFYISGKQNLLLIVGVLLSYPKHSQTSHYLSQNQKVLNHELQQDRMYILPCNSMILSYSTQSHKITTQGEKAETSAGGHQGRSHTPLVLGIIVGAFALLGLAVCIFLCTGGKK